MVLEETEAAMSLMSKWDALAEYMEQRGYRGTDEALDALIASIQIEVDDAETEIEELREALEECRSSRRVWR